MMIVKQPRRKSAPRGVENQEAMSESTSSFLLVQVAGSRNLCFSETFHLEQPLYTTFDGIFPFALQLAPFFVSQA